jgi:hypothetical protein
VEGMWRDHLSPARSFWTLDARFRERLEWTWMIMCDMLEQQATIPQDPCSNFDKGSKYHCGILWHTRILWLVGFGVLEKRQYIIGFQSTHLNWSWRSTRIWYGKFETNFDLFLQILPSPYEQKHQETYDALTVHLLGLPAAGGIKHKGHTWSSTRRAMWKWWASTTNGGVLKT